MNAFDIALTRILDEIPDEILGLAFKDQRNPYNYAVPIEQAIIDKVLTKRLAKDCNLMGGKTVNFTLREEWHEPTRQGHGEYSAGNGPYTVYRIPPEERDNAPLVELHMVTYPSHLAASSANISVMNDGATVANAAQALLDSHTGAFNPARPIGEVLTGNLIRLIPGQYNHLDWVVQARVMYDPNMNNLTTTAIDIYADMAVLRTKYYIYKELIIKLDKAYISGGAEISSIRNIIEDYRDIADRYKELLDDFHGCGVMDPNRLIGLVKRMI